MKLSFLLRLIAYVLIAHSNKTTKYIYINKTKNTTITDFIARKI